MFKKKIYISVLVITITCFPAIVNAQWGGWYSGNSSKTWQGVEGELNNAIPMIDNAGEYVYDINKDTITCNFDLNLHSKIRDFLVVEDSILGKPVTKFSFPDKTLMDDGNTCPIPKIGIYLSDNITTLIRGTFIRFTNSYIHLPNAITNIPDSFLYYNKQLKRIEIPSTVKTIGAHAFQGCDQLDSVKIPSKVKEIKSGVFADCKNLTKIYIPTSVAKIEKNAFKNCKKLTIYCEKNSYAYNYAKKNKIKTKMLSNQVVKAKQIANVPTAINVGTQEAYLLFPFVEPFYATNQKFAYISDNPSIAEVNQNGKVEGKKIGTTTITIMTTDGSNLQKKIKVNVKKGEAVVNPYFSLYQLKNGTTEFNVNAMLYNRNEKATYQLESSNSSIAIAKVVDKKLKVTAKKAGNAVFIVTEINGKNKKEIGSFPISVMDNNEIK